MSDRVQDGSDDTDEKRHPLPASSAGPKQSKRGRPRKHPLPQDSTKSIREIVHSQPSRKQKATARQGLGPQMRPQSPQPSTSRDSLTRGASTSPDYSRGSEAPPATMGPFVEHKLNSSARHMRNLAEKMRRDKLNTYVSELAAIVPPVAESSKKVDKTSVLRLAANFIRMHNMLGGDVATEPILPAGLPGEATRGLMETLGNRFLLVATNTGKIVFVSDAIEQTFGHGQMELLGCSLYSLVHPDDCDLIRTQLTPSDTTRRSFFCRFAEKSLSRNEARSYEIIHVQGRFRPVPETPTPTLIKQEMDEEPLLTSEDTLPPVRHRRSTRHYGSLHVSEDSSGSDDCEEGRAPRSRDTHLLVALVHLIKERPLTELSRVESMRDEYITRHDACGTIMYTDHRITYVTGYMPENVRGSSAFMYMHQNDLLWSLVAQKQMLRTEHSREGVVSYRLRCRDNSYITLHTRGYLELNKQTKEIESFVCINSLVEAHQSEREIRHQRRQLLPIIAGASADDLVTNLSSEFPVEIMEILQNTLGQKKIQQLLCATSTMEKTGTGHSDQSAVTITEVTDGSLPIPVKGKNPRKISGEKKPLKPKPSYEESLGMKSEEEMWITLNDEPSFKSNGRARKRSYADEGFEGKLDINVREYSTRSNSGSSSDSGMMSPNEISQKGSAKICEYEPVRSNKKLRNDRLEEPNTPEASTSWTKDSSTLLPSDHSMTFDEVHPSHQTLVESDAKRKKQMFQMEQMAYSMKHVQTHNRQPNSSPSTTILEEAADEFQTGYYQQKRFSYQPNFQAPNNLNRKNLYASYSQQQNLERNAPNLNDQQLEPPTINLPAHATSSESQVSGLQEQVSPSLNSLRPSLNHCGLRSPSTTASFVPQCPKSPAIVASSSLQFPKRSLSNFLHPSSSDSLSPQSGNNSKQPTQTIPVNSLEDSNIADSLQILDASIEELVNRIEGSPNPQGDNSSATTNESITQQRNAQQPYSADRPTFIDSLHLHLDAQSAQVSPVSPQVYPCTSSLSVSPGGQFLQSPPTGGRVGCFPNASDQQWNQSDHRMEQQEEGHQEELQGLSLEQQTNLVVQNEPTTQQQRQELLLQQQRHQSQTQESLVAQQYCRQGGYGQNL